MSSSIWEDFKHCRLASGLSASHHGCLFCPYSPSHPTLHILSLKANIYRKILSILLARPTLKGRKKERSFLRFPSNQLCDFLEVQFDFFSMVGEIQGQHKLTLAKTEDSITFKTSFTAFAVWRDALCGVLITLCLVLVLRCWGLNSSFTSFIVHDYHWFQLIVEYFGIDSIFLNLITM